MLKLDSFLVMQIHYRRRRKNVLFHEACAQAGITLIDIPYPRLLFLPLTIIDTLRHWWDKKKDSLYGSIAKKNPTILSPKVECVPIPRDPPSEFVPASDSTIINENPNESEKDENEIEEEKREAIRQDSAETKV